MIKKCIYCESKAITKNGMYNNFQKYRCKCCGGQFNESSKNYNAIAAYLQSVIDKKKVNIDTLCAILNVTKSTIYHHLRKDIKYMGSGRKTGIFRKKRP